MNPVTLDDVRAAAERVRGAVYRTPTVRLPLDGAVYAKAENLQRTGSFKLRGAYNFLAALPEAVRRRGVVAHSSGNHAQGVACAAYLFGVHATIVIPDNAPEVKVARTLAWGAEVVRCAPSSAAREEGAARLVRERGYTLVPPFDHPWIIAGQGTAGLELAEDLPGVKNVLVCVGGGGLIAGVATAITGLLPDAQVIGVEPELAADAKDSFDSGTLRQWPAELTGRTVADGVRTQSLGRLNFEIIRRRVCGFVTVSEMELQEATRWYALEAKLVVEPTGALTLAAYQRLLAGPIHGIALQDGPTALLISGGNIAPAMLSAFLSAQR
jgi:threonine dehydratase